MNIHQVAVGSTNPVKIEAVRNVIHQRWPQAEVVGVSVPSGVTDQPTTDAEAIRGARQRSQLARQQLDADLGIGVEGSTVDTDDGMLITGWAVITDRAGLEGLGSGGGFIIPEVIAKDVRRGQEIAALTDKLFAQQNARHGIGLVGLMTDGLVTRTAGSERAVAYALARFFHPELYENA